MTTTNPVWIQLQSGNLINLSLIDLVYRQATSETTAKICASYAASDSSAELFAGTVADCELYMTWLQQCLQPLKFKKPNE